MDKTPSCCDHLIDHAWSEAEIHEVENISGSNVRALLVGLEPSKA
jgi:hypothetical protein